MDFLTYNMLIRGESRTQDQKGTGGVGVKIYNSEKAYHD